MDALLGIGIIILGIFGAYAATFKYSKEMHKRMKLPANHQGFLSMIVAVILQLLPWWVAQSFFLACSLLAIIIGVMILITM